MKEEALLMLFNKEYPEHLLSSKIDTTDERSVCALFKMFAWGYRLAEKHSNSRISEEEISPKKEPTPTTDQVQE